MIPFFANAGDIFVEWFNALGAAVILPVIFTIIGLCLKLKPKDAILAGMTLGIGFTGMGMLISFMFGYMQETMQRFNDLTHMNLKGIDLGWAPLAGLSWAFIWGLLFFPIQIGINILMLIFKKTKTLNLDLWNVWNKILSAIIVQTMLRWTGVSTPLAIALSIAFGSIQIPFELKSGDAIQKQIFEITKIPGVTVPHQMMLFSGIVWPMEWLLQKSKRLNKKIDAQTLKKKLGIFADNGFIGLIVGFTIGLIAYIPQAGEHVYIYKAFVVAIQTATALVLFPMIAKLFMQALAPISTKVDGLMKARFKDRELYIGLDWPILAGSQEMWTSMILWVPASLAYSVGIGYLLGAISTTLTPALPLATMINIFLGPVVLIVSGGNLIHMILLGLIYQPLFLFFAAWFGPVISQYLMMNPEVANGIGLDSETVKALLEGRLAITTTGAEDIWFRFSIGLFCLIFNPTTTDPILGIQFTWIIGLVMLIMWGSSWYWFYRSMLKRSHEIEVRLGLLSPEQIEYQDNLQKLKDNKKLKKQGLELFTFEGFDDYQLYNKDQKKIKKTKQNNWEKNKIKKTLVMEEKNP